MENDDDNTQSFVGWHIRLRVGFLMYEYTIGNNDKAAIHRRWLKDPSPWLVPRYDSLAEVRAVRWQNRPG